MKLRANRKNCYMNQERNLNLLLDVAYVGRQPNMNQDCTSR